MQNEFHIVRLASGVQIFQQNGFTITRSILLYYFLWSLDCIVHVHCYFPDVNFNDILFFFILPVM